MVRGHFLTGLLKERNQDPLGLFTRLRDEGEVVAFRLLWFTVYALNSPEAIKHVLVDNGANYWKGKRIRLFKRVLGEGLLTAEGELWKKNRRLAQPAFHRERLAGLVQAMAQATDDMLERWEKVEGPIDLFGEMSALTLTVVGRTLFGAEVSGDAREVSRALGFLLEETLTFNPLKRLWPSEKTRRYQFESAALDKIIRRIIQERRKDPSPKSDLLGLLMEARDLDDGTGMSDQQLRDEAMTIFLAGHETTAAALTWLWTLLDQNPKAASQVEEEIRIVLGDRPVQVSDLPGLRTVARAFEESMRLYPPAWLMVRQAFQSDEIRGFQIPAGGIVTISAYALHRAKELWENPSDFDPERFLPERSAQRPKFAYLPFGAGQRMCIGSNFAMMQAQVIISKVLQRFRIHIVPNQQIELSPKITLRPKGPVMATLSRAEDRSLRH
jgi:cytochrome P450